MKNSKQSVEFDVSSLVEHELPFMRAYYLEQNELKNDLEDLFSHHTNNKSSTTFYHFTQKEADHIHHVVTEYSCMMESALRKLFSSSHFDVLVEEFFDCEMIRKHGRMFSEYARHTWNEGHPSLYGRYDIVYDPKTESVRGVYEFNGDTPVMLFESTVLQHMFSTHVTGDVDTQFNDWWDRFQVRVGSNVAVFCDTNFVEDTTTCELMAQALEKVVSHGHCSLLDLKHLDFDHLNISKPWVVRDTDMYLDNVFVLSPWEEMIMNFPQGFQNWHRWVDNVKFHEPAWRWFMSHKGMMAYITYLLENNLEFRHRWGHLPVLKTYYSPVKFISSGSKYVSKPVVGRLSMNISIHEPNGSVETLSEGPYSGEQMVYQEYMEPGVNDYGSNFILGAWLSPRTPSKSTIPDVSAICVREFESKILKISNERFAPHILDSED